MKSKWRTRWTRPQQKESPLPQLNHLTSADYEHVYEPSDDTYLFVDVLRGPVRDFLRNEVFCDEPAICCVEIGSGSGTLSATLISELGKSAAFSIATDCNITACKATQSTMVANGLGCYSDSVNCDLVSALRPDTCDIIIFNPPYVPTPSAEVGAIDISAAWAGGRRGREVLDRLLPMLGGFMRRKSVILLLAVEENDPDDIVDVLESQHGYSCCCVGFKRAMNERLVIIMGLRDFHLDA